MDYSEVFKAKLRSPEEKLRDARLAGSVMGRSPEPQWRSEYEREPGLEASNPEDWVPGPGTIKALLAKAALAGKGAMLAGAGIIRKGGREDLVAIHQTSPRKLWPWVQNDKLPWELTAPSLAINKGQIYQDFGDTSGAVTLVARPDALDPKNVGGKLWVRDTYTPRADQFSGKSAEEAVRRAREFNDPWLDETENAIGRQQILQTEARNRNWDRFNQGGFNDMRTMEGAAPDFHHSGTIFRSQNFPSYEAFERSSRGAALLKNPETGRAYDAHIEDAWRKLESLVGQENMRQIFLQQGNRHPNVMKGLHELNANGMLHPEASRQLYNYSRMLGQRPSEYAEQKLTSPVALHGGNWAGAIIREDPELQKAAAEVPFVFGKDLRQAAMYNNDENRQKLIKALTARGIPAVTSRHPEEEYYLARWLSEQAK